MGAINMNLSYYYGHQSDQFSFIRIPKALITEKEFASLSLQAKILYGMLLDRMGMAQKNDWIDEENRVYVEYKISEIMSDMDICKQTAVKLLCELEKVGLIEKKTAGTGQASSLYVKNFISKNNVAGLKNRLAQV